MTNEPVNTPLPVAALDDVLAQYLAAMEPISSAVEFEEIRKEVNAFAAGEGPVLQRRLERWARELHGQSWLKTYSRQRFLSIRAPLTFMGNFTLELTPPPAMQLASTAERAAALVYAAAVLYQKIQRGEIGVPSGNSLSVLEEQIRCVLGCARIPKHGTDDYVVFPTDQVREFGLFYRNHYYLVELFRTDGSIIEPEALCSAIHGILFRQPAQRAVGFHTAAFAGSERCADFLAVLSEDPQNRAKLERMERTLIHLSIRDEERAGLPYNELLYGSGDDLWPYKPWSFTLYSDGALTVNNEHTAADGVTNVFLYEQLLTLIQNCLQRLSHAGDSCKVEEAEFRLVPESRLCSIRKEYRHSISRFCTSRWTRGDIRWDMFRRQGIGRDALIQTAFLYASRRIYSTPRCIHESVSTAQYHQGRTSCLRPVTAEMIRASEMPDDNTALLSALRAMSRAHSEGIRRAKANICFVRHGAGLQQMVKCFGPELGITDIPAIFVSNGYLRFCSQEISTSTIGSAAHIGGFAFSPQVPDGMGIGYLSSTAGLEVFFTWDRTALSDGERFSEGLDLFLDRIRSFQ